MEPRQEDQARLEGWPVSGGGEHEAATAAVRDGFAFDEAALRDWLVLHVDGFSGQLSIERFKGGQSNPTYRLCTPRAHYVLRRKPPGPLLPGAHAIEREVRVLTALKAAGFPVPHIFALCEEPTVIGTPFYIMEMVEGRIFWDATFPSVPHAERSAYFDAMNETISRLHAIDQLAVGLGDYGKPGDYFARQIGRWSKQYLADDLAGRDPNMDYMLEWLPAHIPESDATAIVHGDFRCDNMIFHPTEPRIVAVLDWELSTLGHPFADFAYHAMMYRMPPHVVAGLAGSDLEALGIPSEARYVGDYCGRTGMPDTDYAFALAFNFFRLAAIFHGIKGRAIRGTASSAEAHERARAFPELAALAVAQTRPGCGPLSP